MNSINSLSQIGDLYLYPLKRSNGRLTILREDQHLLRRFGQLQVVSLQAGESIGWSLRGQADELWAPLEGSATVNLIDQRERSPSHGQELKLELNAAEPQALLLPFGVAHKLSSDAAAMLLRLSTHLDGEHPGDTKLTSDQLIKPAK